MPRRGGAVGADEGVDGGALGAAVVDAAGAPVEFVSVEGTSVLLDMSLPMGAGSIGTVPDGVARARARKWTPKGYRIRPPSHEENLPPTLANSGAPERPIHP